MTLAAQVQMGTGPELHPYLFLIFFATLFEYNLHKFVAVFFYKSSLKEPKFHWIANNLRLFYFIFFSSVIGFVITVFFARLEVILALMPLGLVTFLYSFPVYKNKRKIFRLREIPMAKIFIISIVWSVTSYLLPYVYSKPVISGEEILLMIFERILFVFAITVPFDIRDIESDKKTGLKTLPILIGEKRSLMLASLSLGLFSAITLLHYYLKDQLCFSLAFLISGISTIVFLNSVRIRSVRHYHYGILDGTMILQALLLIICYFI